jgi:DNA-binding transcriptional LysR family regulator
MDLRQLSYFVAVAEEGQFTRAAIRVSVAQPAVSAQIRRLEGELGERLFQRDQRGISLTPAGEELLPHAQATLAAAERGRDAIASLRGLLHGSLRIGVSGPIDHRRLAQTLGDFHRAHPGIEIALAEQHNEPLLQALANGALDAGIVGMTGQPVPPPVATRLIAAEPLVLAVPPNHPLGRRKSIFLADLREQPMLSLVRGSGLRRVLEHACRDAGFSPRIIAETGELWWLVELVAEGLGIAVLPRSATAEADVTVLQLSRPRLKRRTALAWNEATTTPAGRAFLELAHTNFSAPNRTRSAAS